MIRYSGAQAGTGGTVTAGTGSAAGDTIHTFTTTGTSAFNLTGLDLNARLGLTLTSEISGTGGFTFNGPGRLTLTGSNNFSGGTAVTGSGSMLVLGHAHALGGSTFTGGDGGLSFGSLSAATFGGLSGGTSLVLSNSSAAAVALSAGVNNQTTTFSGGLSGGGALEKVGSGTLTHAGASNYSGVTTVAAGGLWLSGTLGATPVSVAAGGRFGGTGSLAGNLSFLSGSVFEVLDLADPLAVTGTTTFAAGFGIANLAGIDWDAVSLNTPFTLLSTAQSFDSSQIGNFGSTNAAAVGTGRQAYFESGSLQLIVVPEPGALGLLGLGLGIAALARRGRRCQTFLQAVKICRRAR